VDLFSGIGGFRLGFERASESLAKLDNKHPGIACVFTNEWDKFARKNHEANFGSKDPKPVDARDIFTIQSSDIPSHDILLGGFPCQPFSIAGVSKKKSMGRPHGFACKSQGTLFGEIVRILEHHRPKAFLLENVKNLLGHDRGRTMESIREALGETGLGYKIFVEVLDGGWLVPQHRERVFIAGFKSHKHAREFDWGQEELETKTKPVLSKILHETAGPASIDGGLYTDNSGRPLPKYTLNDKLWNYLEAYAAKHRAKGNGFGRGLFRPDQAARTLPARYYKDGADILIEQEPKNKPKGCQTNPRRLTPRECARLMGFPETYKIAVSDAQAYRLFGNSVVVKLISHIATRFFAAMDPASGN